MICTGLARSLSQCAGKTENSENSVSNSNILGSPISPLRQLTHSGKACNPRFSPQGEYIAFFERVQEVDEGINGTYTKRRLRLLDLNRDTSFLVSRECVDEFAWTPNGKKIVYLYKNYDTGVYQIKEYSLETGMTRTILNGTEATQFSLSKDGKHIAFFNGCGTHLFIMPFDAGYKPKCVATFSIPPCENYPTRADWGVHNSMLALNAYTSAEELWLVSLTENRQFLLDSDDEDGESYNPLFSFDGKSILYRRETWKPSPNSYTLGEVIWSSDVWMLVNKFGERKQLTFWGDVIECGWINDTNIICLRGSQDILYDSDNEEENGEVWLYDLNNQNTTKLVKAREVTTLPDGKMAITRAEASLVGTNIYMTCIKGI